MPRETKEQRMESKRLEQERQNVENADFLAALPMTVIRLMARVEKRHDVIYAVNEHEGLLRVQFEFRDTYTNGDDRDYKNEVNVYLDSNYDWRMRDSVEEIVTLLQGREAADAEAARVRNVAQNAYDSLSDEQRAALGLTRRP